MPGYLRSELREACLASPASTFCPAGFSVTSSQIWRRRLRPSDRLGCTRNGETKSTRNQSNADKNLCRTPGTRPVLDEFSGIPVISLPLPHMSVSGVSVVFLVDSLPRRPKMGSVQRVECSRRGGRKMEYRRMPKQELYDKSRWKAVASRCCLLDIVAAMG